MAYKAITKEGRYYILTRIQNEPNIFKNTNLSYTRIQYFDKIVSWIETYSKKYELDSNILAAQIQQESGFKAGAYNRNPKTKTINAMGITQFLLITVNDVIFGRYKSEFTDTEREKLMVSGITLNSKGFIRSSDRPILLKNISNNPEIMIKAQACYMKKAIADRIKSDLASVCLYSYNRGPAFAKETYGDTILTAFKNNGDPKIYQKKPKTDPPSYNDPPTEGTRYVQIIFNLLKNNFGYKDLDNTIDLDKMGFGNS